MGIGPHGGNTTSLVAAIGALITAAVPPRTADAGNTRASAVLPVGGAWDGAGRLTDSPGAFARVDVDITCPVDAAGMFYIIHGPTVAAVDLQDPTVAAANGCVIESWPAVSVWAALRAPIGLLDKAYRLAWRGTAGSTVAIAATLDPRTVSEAHFLLTVISVGPGAITSNFNLPPGARSFIIEGIHTDGGILTTADLVRQYNAAGTSKAINRVSAEYGAGPVRIPLRLSQAITYLGVTEGDAGKTMDATIFWYANR